MVHLSPDAGPAIAERSEVPRAPGKRDGRRASEALGALVLGSYKESSAPRVRDPRTGCPRWPENLWLLSSQGQLVQGRCSSTNLCDYCAVQAAWENTTLLTHDALVGVAPEVVMILGTRTATVETRPFYRGLSEAVRALRREWPEVSYARLSEFTTGYGPLAGGERRPHWNLTVKGIPADEATAAGAVAFAVWCRYVDAEDQAQYAAPIRDVGGLMPYLAQHFAKQSQRPPDGFRGHRFRTSAGYLWTDTPTARATARESLQVKRDLWRAVNELALGAHDAELYAHEQAERRKATEWRMWWAPTLKAGAADHRPGAP